MSAEIETSVLVSDLDRLIAERDRYRAEWEEAARHALRWQAEYDTAQQEVERLRHVLETHEAQYRRHRDDGYRLSAKHERQRDEARAALDRVRAVWQPHLDAVPLGLPCQCVGCQMGRAIDGVQPPHDGDETAGQDRRTTIDAITHDPCCSSHGKALTCAQYRRTHFVEVRPCCAHDARALDGAS